YINDLPSLIPPPAEIALYADDVTIFLRLPTSPSSYRDSIVAAANQAIHKIACWAEKWRLKLSPEKQQFIILSRKRDSTNCNISNPPLLKYRHHLIPYDPAASLKILGVHLDPQLPMATHIDYIVARATPRITALKSIAHSAWGAD